MFSTCYMLHACFQMLRGRVTERDFFWSRWWWSDHNTITLKFTVGRRCTCLNSWTVVRRHNTQAERRTTGRLQNWMSNWIQRDWLKQLCFTTHVVINMKSQHLLSSVHDLVICTRSAQTWHKEEDFITTSQTVISQYSAEFFTQTGLTALPSRRFLQISYPQFHNSASHARRFHAESGSGYFLRIWIPSHDAWAHFPLDVVMQHSRRSPSADFSHLSNGIRKRSDRQHHEDHNGHSHTDPEPAARRAHIPHVPD